MHLYLRKAESLQVGNLAYFAVVGGGSIKMQAERIELNEAIDCIEVIGVIKHVSPRIGQRFVDLIGQRRVIGLYIDHTECVINELSE